MNVDAEEAGLFAAGLEIKNAVAVVVTDYGNGTCLHERIVHAFVFTEAEGLSVLSGLEDGCPGGVNGIEQISQSRVGSDAELSVVPRALPFPEHPHDVVEVVGLGVIVADTHQVEVVVPAVIAEHDIPMGNQTLDDGCKFGGNFLGKGHPTRMATTFASVMKYGTGRVTDAGRFSLLMEEAPGCTKYGKL